MFGQMKRENLILLNLVLADDVLYSLHYKVREQRMGLFHVLKRRLTAFCSLLIYVVVRGQSVSQHKCC